jgi:hypothetical protein
MAIEEVVTAPRSPWQNAYVERIIGSIRRECLDHVVVFSRACWTYGMARPSTRQLMLIGLTGGQRT